MAVHNAVIATTNQSLSNGEDQVLQYLSSQLTGLDIFIKDTRTIINDEEHLLKFIQTWFRTTTFIFYSGNLQFICNALSKIYNQPLVGNCHLASIYKMNTENIGDPEDIKLVTEMEIYPIKNPANGTNHVLTKYLDHIILPIDFNSIRAIMDNLIKPFFYGSFRNERFLKHLTYKYNQNDTDAELDQLIHNINQSVNIKRYYVILKEEFKLNIVLSSSNFNDITNYIKKVYQIMGNNMIWHVVGGSVWDDVVSVTERDYVKEAIRVIENCLRQYSPKEVFLSFNGGKDCTVLLCLTLHVLQKSYPLYREPLLSLYIQSPNPFSEVEAFIEKCQQFYNLKVVTINSLVKTGLRKLLTEQPHFKACLMGTRRTDPYSQHLNHFQMTDPDWPQIMRVNPILDWKYSDVWNFLLSCKVPYCELYDLGYTSLGSRTNTRPNPSLKILDEVTRVEKYLPAYKLQNGADERSGRLQK